MCMCMYKCVLTCTELSSGTGGHCLQFSGKVSLFFHNEWCVLFVCVCVCVRVCRYVVTLGAPISIAQRMGEDTLTYLNKGIYVALSNMYIQ